jgi:hypothetical protein
VLAAAGRLCPPQQVHGSERPESSRYTGVICPLLLLF